MSSSPGPTPATVSERSWEEFREAGLLWWVNRALHLFGWAIVVNVEDDGRVSNCYPARVLFRGFDRASEEDGFRKVSAYLAENATELKREAD